MEPARQLDLLDRYADTEAARERGGGAGRRVGGRAGPSSSASRTRRARAKRQEDLLRFQLSEIDAVRLREGEEDELRAERRRLQHAERIAAGLAEVTALLYEDERSAAARLRPRGRPPARPRRARSRAAARPPRRWTRRDAYLEEAIGRARALRDRAVSDPGRLERDRRPPRRHRPAQAQVRRDRGRGAAYRAGIAAALDRLERHDELVAELEARVAARRAEAAARAALALGEARTAPR